MASLKQTGMATATEADELEADLPSVPGFAVVKGERESWKMRDSLPDAQFASPLLAIER